MSSKECFNFSSRFDLVRQDPRQRLSAEKILSNSVTMISGRGGTGKTEVVTSTLEAIKEKLNESNVRFLFRYSW